MIDEVKGIALFGAGRHAKVVYEILRVNRLHTKLNLMVADRDINLVKTSLFYDFNFLKESDISSDVKDKFNISHFIIGFAGENTLKIRMKCYEKGVSLGLTPLSIIHINSDVAKSAQVGLGVQVMSQSVINVDSSIADNSIINTGAIVEHDCAIGKGTHIAPGAVLGGGVKVGDSTFIGLGAKILHGVTIGNNVIIGAGSVVTKDISDGKIAYGVPAIEQQR